MRGKEGLPHGAFCFLGITPAYAGKSDPKVLGIGNAEDHPRLCGEKSGILRANAATIGSPPPMRGKATLYIDQPAIFRITPAYAGKSPVW